MAAIAYAALAGYQIISGLQQAEMIRTQAGIQKEIDEFNASLAEYDAWRVQGYGQTQMARYQSQLDQAEAAGRVSAAAAGADIRQGSLAEVAAENRLTGMANMLDIENQARERALGYTRQARAIRSGSRVNQAQSDAQASSVIGGSIARAAATGVSYLGTQKPLGKAESGYEVPNKGSQALSMSQDPGSYLTGVSVQPRDPIGYVGFLP